MLRWKFFWLAWRRARINLRRFQNDDTLCLELSISSCSCRRIFKRLYEIVSNTRFQACRDDRRWKSYRVSSSGRWFNRRDVVTVNFSRQRNACRNSLNALRDFSIHSRRFYRHIPVTHYITCANNNACTTLHIRAFQNESLHFGAPWLLDDLTRIRVEYQRDPSRRFPANDHIRTRVVLFLIDDTHVRRLRLHSCAGISLSCYLRALLSAVRFVDWFNDSLLTI